MRLRWALVGVFALAVIGACGGSQTKAPVLPKRHDTVGDDMLSAIPFGADLVIEINLKRLRSNAVVGPLLETFSPSSSSVIALPGGRAQPAETIDLLQSATALLVCVYNVGDSPKQLVVFRSSELASENTGRLPDALRLASDLYAVGDPELLLKAAALASDPSLASVLTDTDFLALRDLAMPKASESAAVRVTALLDFDARVAIAATVATSAVPIAISLWADVVDDLAIIALLRSEDVNSLPGLERGLAGLVKIVSNDRWLRRVGVVTAIRSAKLTRSESDLRVVFLLGPKRLQAVVQRLLQSQSSNQKPAP